MDRTMKQKAVFHARNAVNNLERVTAFDQSSTHPANKQRYDSSLAMLELWQFILKAVEAYDETEA